MRWGFGGGRVPTPRGYPAPPPLCALFGGCPPRSWRTAAKMEQILEGRRPPNLPTGGDRVSPMAKRYALRGLYRDHQLLRKRRQVLELAVGRGVERVLDSHAV